MKHKKRETERSIDSIRFKLQKPIAKDDNSSKVQNKPNKKRWWKDLFKWKWPHRDHHHHDEVHQACRARQAFRASISGPVYLTESRSGPTSPYRTTGRPSSSPLAGTLTPAAKGEGHVGVPYLSLRELNMEQQQRMSTSALPLYLVA